MTWFKADDAFWRHRKVRKLGKDKLPAAGLWVLAGTWCTDNIATSTLDGWIPAEAVEAWDPRLRYAKRLVDVGLWHEVEHEGEAGYRYHDWSEFQRTKAEVEAERETWRAKKAGQRKGKTNPPVSPGDNRGDRTGTPPETPQGRPPRFPDPIPIPIPSSGSLRGEGHLSNAQAREKRPLDRCPQHATDERPPPCGACGDARRAADAIERQHAETTRNDHSAAAWQRAEDRALAIAACHLCDPDGQIGRQTCDHDPAAADRAARGRAAVQAALNRQAAS